MKPRLMRGGLSDQLYIVTRYRPNPHATAPGSFIAQTKYPVSEEELADAFLVTVPIDSRDLDEFDIEVRRISPAPVSR